jgi:hypothetical protein
MAVKDNPSLILNLDKIVYVAAGAIALVLLLLPMFSGGGLNEAAGQVQTKVRELSAKPRTVPRREVENITDILQKQWQLPPPQPFPAWASERRPAYLQWYKGAETEIIRHALKPSVAQIEYLRSAEKLQTYLKVTGALGTINFPDKGVFVDAKLYRREGDGPFVEVKDFDGKAAVAAGAVDYSDFSVKPGKLYGYKVSSRVGLRADAVNAKVEPGADQTESAELLLTQEVPYDYALDWIQLNPFDPKTGKEANFFGTLQFADFADGGKVVKLSSRTFERLFEFGAPWERGKHWRIVAIDDGKVDIRNNKTTLRESLTARNSKRAVELPAAVAGGAPAEDAQGGAAAAAPPAVNDGAGAGAGKEAEPAPEPAGEAKPAPEPSGGETKKGKGRIR